MPATAFRIAPGRHASGPGNGYSRPAAGTSRCCHTRLNPVRMAVSAWPNAHGAFANRPQMALGRSNTPGCAHRGASAVRQLPAMRRTLATMARGSHLEPPRYRHARSRGCWLTTSSLLRPILLQRALLLTPGLSGPVTQVKLACAYNGVWYCKAVGRMARWQPM